MEPIAIVTAFVAVLVIAGRGGLLFAPAATVDRYRRMTSTLGRVRILGAVLLVLVASPLIVTARQAHPDHANTTILLEGLGWIGAFAVGVLIAVPDFYQRFALMFFETAANPVLRALGALNIAFGLYLGWVAFYVL